MTMRAATRPKRKTQVRMLNYSLGHIMCHVWQIFDHMLPESHDADERNRQILKGHEVLN